MELGCFFLQLAMGCVQWNLLAGVHNSYRVHPLFRTSMQSVPLCVFRPERFKNGLEIRKIP